MSMKKPRVQGQVRTNTREVQNLDSLRSQLVSHFIYSIVRARVGGHGVGGGRQYVWGSEIYRFMSSISAVSLYGFDADAEIINRCLGGWVGQGLIQLQAIRLAHSRYSSGSWDHKGTPSRPTSTNPSTSAFCFLDRPQMLMSIMINGLSFIGQRKFNL
ncbi:hypothetical protein M413DRAFT_6787 [Hebeloma cylindrosporum]|uniref:Uncharacterized protein n=1 Tax=Hebeloma cylindrosporum TaxID=76867 RepID=A0A0C2Z2F3_HEBCY|nr:hypothetical protein M413DRAFT_6787 [Hebeloma cylindrosporum h7]